MDHYIVHDPNGPDLEFDGELLLKEQHHDTGFVEIYRTAGGAYILKRNLSSRPGSVLINEVRIADSLAGVLESLGHGHGAKQVRSKLQIYETQRIDRNRWQPLHPKENLGILKRRHIRRSKHVCGSSSFCPCCCCLSFGRRRRGRCRIRTRYSIKRSLRRRLATTCHSSVPPRQKSPPRTAVSTMTAKPPTGYPSALSCHFDQGDRRTHHISQTREYP